MNNDKPAVLDITNPLSANGWKRLFLILTFAFAMGLLEAICVIYLRRLIMPDGLESGHAPARLGRHVELIREASAIVMLVTTAWLAGTNIRSRLAAFFVMFGIWDILSIMPVSSGSRTGRRSGFNGTAFFDSKTLVWPRSGSRFDQRFLRFSLRAPVPA